MYLDIYEVYRKMSFRNRCMIAGAQGIISLSVPLKEGRNQQLPMNEVMISDTEKWQARHFKSIHSAYNRSPFFEYYHDELGELYQQPFIRTGRMESALSAMAERKNWTGRQKSVLRKRPFPFRFRGCDDRRNQVLPKNYHQWNPVKYRQVFEERTGFFPNLSILDLLFNTGPQAGELLEI